jgi:hypothetical protein
MERITRVELATFSMATRRSTTELNPLKVQNAIWVRQIINGHEKDVNSFMLLRKEAKVFKA